MSDETEKSRHYLTIAEIETLARKFESCAVPCSEFDHRAHLIVAAWYLSRLNMTEALEQMRRGLLRLLEHYQLEGYHETITQFWLKLVRSHLARADASCSLADLTNELLATYKNSRLVFDYYSRDLLQSPTAKASWVEPDLKPLDF